VLAGAVERHLPFAQVVACAITQLRGRLTDAVIGVVELCSQLALGRLARLVDVGQRRLQVLGRGLGTVFLAGGFSVVVVAIWLLLVVGVGRSWVRRRACACVS
jgi:hypothetical protein